MNLSKYRRRRWGFTLVAVATLGMVLSGCGIGEGSAIKINHDDTIKVGVIPVADFAPVYIAMDRGFFADEGLNVETQVMQNAAAIAPAVINGQLQFGTSAQTPFLTAAQKGLPLKAIANSANTASAPGKDVSALMVAADSDIKRPKDLEGRTVAVNALNSIIHVAASEVVRADGGDPSKVKFIAMPLPDMANAVATKRVDAASVVEPFAALGSALGNKSIASPYTTAFSPGETYALVFTATPFIDTNPDVVRKFTKALNRASEVAASNPGAVREILVKYGRLNPKAAAAMRLPNFGPTISASALSKAADLMVDLGFVPETLNGEDLIWK